MRLLHMTSSGELGGAEAVALEILSAVRVRHPEWRLELIAPREGTLAQKARGAGVAADVISFPRRFAATGEAGAPAIRVVLNLLLATPALLAYVRNLRAALGQSAGSASTVVHAHGFKAQVLTALAARRPVRVIWHVHDYVGGRPVSRRLLRWLASRTCAIVANSESVAADVRRVCPASRVLAIHNGVDLSRFAPLGETVDLDRLGGVAAPPAGTLRVGMVGMFGRWKGHEVLLNALAEVRDLPIRAYVVGTQSYDTAGSQVSERELRQLAISLGVSDRMVFTGPVRDVASVMRALDVVVHASTLPEPFGMVIAEAMACGRPVVVSHAGGAAELVQPDVDGLAHAPGDASGLAACLRSLAADPALRARLGAAARDTAIRRFDARRLVSQLELLYASI